MEAKQLMEKIVTILDGKKAEDIRAIRIGDLTILADYFVIAAGSSSTQVKMLADEVDYHSENWIVLDYSDVVVHIFQKETRSFYDLERLWADGEQTDISHLLKQD